MANNRLWLVHTPSRLAFHLAKRMGWGWYPSGDDAQLASLGTRLASFLDACMEFDTAQDKGHDGHDAFALALEDGEPRRIAAWRYVGDYTDAGQRLEITLAPPPMTEARARWILGGAASIADDGRLRRDRVYRLSWPVGAVARVPGAARLDGDFTADELEAIAWWMRKNQSAKEGQHG